MARCSEHHKTLDDHGAGKCSVPMWMNGCPAGFCDEPAYGNHEGRFNTYDGYIPALACYAHGGPKEKGFVLDDMECADGEGSPICDGVGDE